MTVNETIKYFQAMKKTAENDHDPRAAKCVEACENVLKLIDERRALQSRCIVFSGGSMCWMCGMECNALGKR